MRQNHCFSNGTNRLKSQHPPSAPTSQSVATTQGPTPTGFQSAPPQPSLLVRSTPSAPQNPSPVSVAPQTAHKSPSVPQNPATVSIPPQTVHKSPSAPQNPSPVSVAPQTVQKSTSSPPPNPPSVSVAPQTVQKSPSVPSQNPATVSVVSQTGQKSPSAPQNAPAPPATQPVVALQAAPQLLSPPLFIASYKKDQTTKEVLGATIQELRDSMKDVREEIEKLRRDKGLTTPTATTTPATPACPATTTPPQRPGRQDPGDDF